VIAVYVTLVLSPKYIPDYIDSPYAKPDH